MPRKFTEKIAMTARTRSTMTFFTLAFAFLLISVLRVSAEPKWESEVSVNVWCYQAEAIEAVIEAAKAGDTDESDNIAHSSIRNGICRALPMPMGGAFRPSKEYKRYYDFDGVDVVIIEGNIIRPDDTLGKHAFVLIPLSILHTFIVGTEPVRYQET